jgi:hypothetical protein
MSSSNSTTTSSPPFDEVRKFVEALGHDELVAAVGKAWDDSPALRGVLDRATSDSWSASVNQAEMLDHDWATEVYSPEFPPTHIVRFKTPSPISPWVNICGWKEPLNDVRAMLTGWRRELFFKDRLGTYSYGCGECGAEGSNCRATLQVNRKGERRLLVELEQICRCLKCCDDEPDLVESESYTLFVADEKPKPAPKPKAAKKRAKKVVRVSTGGKPPRRPPLGGAQ